MLSRLVTSVSLLVLLAPGLPAQGRPVTFLDVQLSRSAGSADLSPDGRTMLYTLSVPDWKEARSTTDIWLVPVAEGPAGARQLTFTPDKSESSPRWGPDGRWFVFSSNREGTGATAVHQLFLMRPDGGEARRLTDARDGVAGFAFTRDGQWLVYAAGKADARQLWALPVAGIETAEPVQLTKHPTPVEWWRVAPDSRGVYYIAADTVDTDERTRRDKKFTVNIRNAGTPPEHLWHVAFEGKATRRMTGGTEYSVSTVTLSRDGRWIGFRGTPNDRYQRNVTETSIYGDMYLLEAGSGRIERLTRNAEVGESSVSFSPDGSLLAIAAPNDWTYFRDNKIWVRPTAQAGAPWRKLGASYDGDLNVGFWSDDGTTIYANDGIRATGQVVAVSVADGSVRQVTRVTGVVSASHDEERGHLLVSYTDPVTPPDLYLAASPADLADRTRWQRLTDANPDAAGLALGQTEEITWRSRDGRMVGGVLVKPVGWQPGRRAPLIVDIHGGPASAEVLRWDLAVQVYAGAGYAVFLPNYRGSTNYGERHRLDIVGKGNYFQKGYEDIMTGVDHLIAQGIVHPDSLGAMGWSAGGHWSNWILTHTTRFKAISSGAGAVNWISMYAQSDVQRNRAEYFARGVLPYDDFAAYWDVSPLKYIKAARTPTMIHVVDGDPRVPRPQSEELHMALKKLGVPTEFFVYPGNTHGIPDSRNRYAKAMAEFAWFEHWIRGGPAFSWKPILASLSESAPGERTAGGDRP